MAYGPELILDLYDCDQSTFNRQSISDWLDKLCVLIDMNQEDLHFWDYEGLPEKEIPYDQPHLLGVSAVQFITTSNITIHTLTAFNEVYINLFTCKPFDVKKAVEFTKEWFGAKVVDETILIRGRYSKRKDG